MNNNVPLTVELDVLKTIVDNPAYHKMIPVHEYNEDSGEFGLNFYQPEAFFDSFIKERVRSEAWNIVDYHEKKEHGKSGG